MTNAHQCPDCGAEKAAGSPCANCLMKLGIESSASSSDAETVGWDEKASRPERIGPYRILEILGEGGMGVVYLAEQQEPVRRQVALKIVKRGMDSEQVLARFEAERQALALMDHPALATVLDAGVTPDGRPFFVMEYVRGEPITEHCDRHRLTNRQRLDLFRKVCEGVQHAHHKAIIHRDLKPSNILVAVVDGQAWPKIIDFGIAKAVGQKLSAKTFHTQLGSLIGTPAYMSPEQAELTRQDVDTRTDVYALGVILYELLVGALPFEPTELLEAGLEAMVRKICSEEPSKPSRRFSTLGNESAEFAKLRRADPSALHRELSGDLDWIVMKALEKERSRRYNSPGDLVADIDRHLAHEPVLAGPPSIAYRAKKFVRRHRLGVAIAVVALLVVFGFAVRERAQAARIAHEAATAKRVSEFLVGLFNVSDPSEARGNSITAREILDNGALEIEKELADEPELQAQLMDTMGSVYVSLGLYSSAEPLLERARGNLERELGAEHPETLRSASNLAQLYMAQARYDEAESLHLDLLQTRRRVLGSEHVETLASTNGLAAAYQAQGRYDEAEPLMLEVLRTRERLLGADDPSVMTARSNLAGLYESQGRYAEAEPLRLESLAARERVLGGDHPDTLESMNSLAILYMDFDRHDEAEPIFIDVLDGRNRVLGHDHPATLRTLNDLAYLYISLGRYDDAEPLLLESVEAKKRKLGGDHTSTLISMANLARVYSNQARYDEAEALYLEGLEGFRRTLGDEHTYTLMIMNNLAVMYHRQKRYDDAEPLFAADLDASRRALGEDHPETLISMGNLGGLYNDQGRFDEAEPLLVEAQRRVRSALPREHAVTGYTIRKYGSCLTGLGRYDEAEPILLESHEILMAAVGDDHARTKNAVRALAELYEAWARPEQAAEWSAKLESDE